MNALISLNKINREFPYSYSYCSLDSHFNRLAVDDCPENFAMLDALLALSVDVVGLLSDLDGEHG